jgi:hypothetical protein
MQHSLGSIKRKGFCEIAVSPFDPAHLVHTGGDDRRAPNHDELILGALPPTLGSNAEWIGQTASVRLSSGCAVIVAPESGVPLMHMLQVCLNDIYCSMHVLLISHHPPPPSLVQWRPCGDARTDLFLTQFVSASERSPPKLQRHTVIKSPAQQPIVACAFIENQANTAAGHQLIIVTTAAMYVPSAPSPPPATATSCPSCTSPHSLALMRVCPSPASP